MNRPKIAIASVAALAVVGVTAYALGADTAPEVPESVPVAAAGPQDAPGALTPSPVAPEAAQASPGATPDPATHYRDGTPRETPSAMPSAEDLSYDEVKLREKVEAEIAKEERDAEREDRKDEIRREKEAEEARQRAERRTLTPEGRAEAERIRKRQADAEAALAGFEQTLTEMKPLWQRKRDIDHAPLIVIMPNDPDEAAKRRQYAERQAGKLTPSEEARLTELTKRAGEQKTAAQGYDTRSACTRVYGPKPEKKPYTSQLPHAPSVCTGV